MADDTSKGSKSPFEAFTQAQHVFFLGSLTSTPEDDKARSQAITDADTMLDKARKKLADQNAERPDPLGKTP